MKRTNTILYLVVPCYNEEEVLHKSAAVLFGQAGSADSGGDDFG